MIVYDRLWALLKDRKITVYTLREKYGLEQKTIKRLMNNQNVTTKTLDKICTSLQCGLDEIAEYMPD